MRRWLLPALAGCLVCWLVVPVMAQTPGTFTVRQQLSSAALNAALGLKADALNPVITGSLTLGGTGPITGFGTGIGQALGPFVNYQGSGKPGLLLSTGGLVFAKSAPGITDSSDVLIQRTTSFTGGTLANINSTLRIDTHPGAGDGTSAWGITSVNTSSSNSNANALGGDFQAVRLSGNASLFAAVLEARDQTGLSSLASGSAFGEVSLELDLTSTGLDNAANAASLGGTGVRNFMHLVGATWQGVAGPHEIAHGIWVATAQGTYVDSVYAFDGGGGGAQIRNALDTRNAITPTGSANPVSAVTMSAGHVIDFNGPTTITGAPRNTLTFDSGTGKLFYAVAGVNKWSVDASGNVRAAGTVTGSVTP